MTLTDVVVYSSIKGNSHFSYECVTNSQNSPPMSK